MTTMNVPSALSFGVDEHRARAERVRTELERRGIDTLLVTSPPNVLYLTGYEAAWFPPRLPVGVVVSRTSPDLVFLDWTRHVDYVRRWALYDDVILFEYEDWLEAVVRAAGQRGWSEGTFAVEPSASNPTGAVLNRLAAGLRAAGIEVVDGDFLVDDVRLYKTDGEIERIRRAATIADAAFTGLREQLRPGLSELEVAGRVSLLLAEHGSELAASPPFVSSGPDAWRDTHAFPSTRTLEDGDVLAVDICAVIDRYHVNLSRAFAIGTPSASARALIGHTEDGVHQMVAAARIGEGPQHALAAAEAFVRERIPPENVWWIGGYSLGLGCPPSWVGHRYLANQGAEPFTWQPGYLSNYETILFDRAEGYAAPIIDSVLMTPDGLEVLSKLPRGLLET
jgi:Xaa-Pro aminopeptidase